MAVSNYDPKNIVVTFKGYILNGFMEGTWLSAERDAESFETSVGADGSVTRVRKHNRVGTVTLTLQAESPSNTILSDSINDDEISGTGSGNLQIKDLNGNTLLSSEEAWLKKPANVEYSDGASSREWVFACADLFMQITGNE